MIWIFALLTAAILTFEGALLLQVVTRKRDTLLLQIALGYPLGALVNVFVFFFINLFGIPLTIVPIAILHVVALIALFLFAKKRSVRGFVVEQGDTLRCHPLLIALCAVFIALAVYASFTYALTLPSFYWDGFTAWAMRAKQSFVAGKFLMEGVIQPQYPVLMHSLYMVYMLPLGWSDMLVQFSTTLLSLSGFSAVFIVLRRLHGSSTSLICLALLTGLPIAVIHLRQGYCDIHISVFVLLSALFLSDGIRKNHASTLALSAILCAAAAWTKWEGLYFALVPWCVVVGLNARNKSIARALALALALALPWSVFVLLQGLPLSPHGGSFGIHLSALPVLIDSLFGRGTFGLHWWAIIIVSALFLHAHKSKLLKIPSRHPEFLWAVLSVVLLLGVYLFTNDVKGLIQGDNFSRALIMPTLLLTQTLAIWGVKKN